MPMTGEQQNAFLLSFRKALRDKDPNCLSNLRKAVAHGYDVNHSNTIDYTDGALKFAFGRTALAHAVEHNRADCVAFLLTCESIKTDIRLIDSEDSIEGIPLHIAAYRGYLDIILMLVKKSPNDLDNVDSDGFTPLHEAVIGGKFEAFKLLLRLGANDEEVRKRSQGSLEEIQEGSNTLQVILYSTKIYNDASLCQMWQYLIRHKLSKGEAIVGNITEEDEDVECIEDEISIERLLEIAGRQNFRDAYNHEVGRFKQEDDDFSDTDSEADVDYSEEDILEDLPNINVNTIATQGAAPHLVMHARGQHFYSGHETYASRKRYVMFSRAQPQDDNRLGAWGLYSDDTHKRAKISFELPQAYDPTRDERLEQAAQATRDIIQWLSQQRDMQPVLQRSSSQGNRQRFESRLIELVQRYVNSYRTLSEDIQRAQEAQSKTVEERQTDRTKMKQHILVQFKAHPFVSFSEDIRVAVQYATGYLNYDKKRTHQPYEKLEFTMTPQYKPDGDLRHPYLGVIYITLHAQTSLTGCSLNIAELFRDDKIDPTKGPGTHETSGYVRALERVFFAGVSKDHICLAKIIRLPNLYYPFRPFVLQKYGLSESEYNGFKEQLASAGKINPVTGKMNNEQNFYRVQEQLIGKVIEHQRTHLIATIEEWADWNDLSVGTLDDNGQFVETLDIDAQNKIRSCQQTREGHRNGL